MRIEDETFNATDSIPTIKVIKVTSEKDEFV